MNNIFCPIGPLWTRIVFPFCNIWTQCFCPHSRPVSQPKTPNKHSKPHTKPHTIPNKTRQHRDGLQMHHHGAFYNIKTHPQRAPTRSGCVFCLTRVRFEWLCTLCPLQMLWCNVKCHLFLVRNGGFRAMKTSLFCLCAIRCVWVGTCVDKKVICVSFRH